LYFICLRLINERIMEYPFLLSLYSHISVFEIIQWAVKFCTGTDTKILTMFTECLSFVWVRYNLLNTIFFICVYLFQPVLYHLGIPRVIYSGCTIPFTNLHLKFFFWVFFGTWTERFGVLQSLSPFGFFSKCVEVISEAVCDADDIYVVLQNQRWGKRFEYCWSVVWE
jgi:hypothetical protein